jgi:hypothetical protein
MIHSFDDRREQLRDVDAELTSLLQRRIELAIEFLQLLRTDELSLGDLDQDALRLGILLSSDCEGDFMPLDEAAVKKIFWWIAIETSRLAYSNISPDENHDTKLTCQGARSSDPDSRGSFAKKHCPQTKYKSEDSRISQGRHH